MRMFLLQEIKLARYQRTERDKIYTTGFTSRMACIHYSVFPIDCKIPRGSLYDRATFRLQYGNSIDPLARGETVNQYNKVVVICKKDILTDVAMNYHVITCHRGRWKPNLPACAGKHYLLVVYSRTSVARTLMAR